MLAMLSVMKASMRMVKNQAMEPSNGRMETNMLDISKMMSDQVLEHIISPMMKYMKAIGRMGKGMDLD
jgi:hypothetical protein